jgi:hypothetical protein
MMTVLAGLADVVDGLANAPTLLKGRKQWVVWYFGKPRDGKLPKIPFDAATGKKINGTDPANWMSYEEAILAYEKNDKASGIGFALAGDGLMGIDIDDCVNVNGWIEPWAQEIVNRTPTYWEYSPSGTGLRSFAINEKLAALLNSGERKRKGQIEIYAAKRFLTVTGDHLPGTPDEVRDCTAELNALYVELFAVPQGNSHGDSHSGVDSGPLPMGDDRIIELAARINGEKFEKLWSGDLSDYRGDHSSADMALCMILAFYTRDPEQIDRLFRRSGLYRDKWERRDYMERTVNRALERQTDCYRASIKLDDEQTENDQTAGSGANPREGSADSDSTMSDATSTKEPNSTKSDKHDRRNRYARKVYAEIKREGGVFIQDEQGYSILKNKRRIPINADLHNVELAKLFQRAGADENFTNEGKAIVQRLLVLASEEAKNMHARKFSAMSPDRSRIYIPTTKELLEVSAGGLKSVPNGSNDDRVWLEHSYGDPLLVNPSVDVQAVLKRFEELIIETATCATPEMKWLLAMNSALFSFIRDSVTARMLTLLTGPSQNGKTTAARRYHLLLHGRQPGINEDVLGDFSVATLGNLGDTGFIVMDNKETADMRRDFINFLLYLATGAERGRSTSDGSIRPRLPGRPVGVVTSIEGFSRNELQLRTAIIKFERHGKPIDNYPIEQAILAERHDIISALVEVLRRYLQLSPTGQEPPKDSTFTGHWEALCLLLYAYADVTGRTRQWCNSIIKVWREQFEGHNEAKNESEIETLIEMVLDESDLACAAPAFTHEGRLGKLFIFPSWTDLLQRCAKHNVLRIDLPKTGEGLSSRIRSDSKSFRHIAFLPTDSTEELKRKNSFRPFGFFVPE